MSGAFSAGALAFAMVPLQCAAEWLAEKAVPVGVVSGVAQVWIRPDDGDRDALDRTALRALGRDGVLARREEVHVAEAAERLGIGPRRALEIRGEVEEEWGPPM